MNHSLVIARRELRDRTRLFVLAVAFAVIPFLAAQMPGARNNRIDVIAMGAAILGAALGVGAAIILGNTVIGRELSERRLSFYFSKPISPAALWVGKAAAALAASIACFLIVVMPAFLLVGKSWHDGIVTAPQVVLTGTIAITVLFFVSHALSTIVRSRAPLIALDLTLAAIAAASMYLIVRTLARAGAVGFWWILPLCVAGGVLVLAVAPVWQLANGRTDVRRNHAAFSRVVWPAIAAILLVAGAFVGWLVTPDADDIAEVQMVQQAPHGDWSIVGGAMRNRGSYHTAFAVNRTNGEWVRLPSPLWWGVTFSRDGRTLAWVQPEGVFGSRALYLYTRRLDARDAKNVDTGIRTSHDSFALSDDGSRVAVFNDRLVAVHDVTNGRILASAPLGGSALRMIFFTTPDTVRILERGRREGDALRVYELNVATRSFTKTGERLEGGAVLSASGDGSRMLLRRDVIADGRTAQTIATLPAWPATMNRPRMLHDGSIARTGVVAGTAHAQILNAEGALLHDVVLPDVRNAVVADATADRKLIVLGSREVGKDRRTFVIDMASGKLERTMAGIRGPYHWWASDPRRTPFHGELLSTDASGDLIAWNHTTGQSRKLF